MLEKFWDATYSCSMLSVQAAIYPIELSILFFNISPTGSCDEKAHSSMLFLKVILLAYIVLIATVLLVSFFCNCLSHRYLLCVQVCMLGNLASHLISFPMSQILTHHWHCWIFFLISSALVHCIWICCTNSLCANICSPPRARVEFGPPSLQYIYLWGSGARRKAHFYSLILSFFISLSLCVGSSHPPWEACRVKP